ncbi:MAG: AAA domain-containing protein [Candidatus Magasanikbacteria bacterium]|jgi:energy-coupling factor transporter ATP-binding protein EcfA2|nr:AAA domain-containing protein [Candidatus Magasanikbacteria bacterium]
MRTQEILKQPYIPEGVKEVKVTKENSVETARKWVDRIVPKEKGDVSTTLDLDTRGGFEGESVQVYTSDFGLYIIGENNERVFLGKTQEELAGAAPDELSTLITETKKEVSEQSKANVGKSDSEKIREMHRLVLSIIKHASDQKKIKQSCIDEGDEYLYERVPVEKEDLNEFALLALDKELMEKGFALWGQEVPKMIIQEGEVLRTELFRLIGDLEGARQKVSGTIREISLFTPRKTPGEIRRLTNIKKEEMRSDSQLYSPDGEITEEGKKVLKEYFQMLNRGGANKGALTSRLVTAKNVERRLEKELAQKLHPEVPTEESVEAIADYRYVELQEYLDQLNTGKFMWTPSRRKFLQNMLGQSEKDILVILGPSGTGKSVLAEAFARITTGQESLTVNCSEKTSQEVEAEMGFKDGESVWNLGPLAQAMKDGRVCRFEEAYRMNPEGDLFAILKTIQQKSIGDKYRLPGGEEITIQPGFRILFTTNPEMEGRYPGRNNPESAFRRECAILNLLDMEQSNENPEVHTALLVASSTEGKLTSIDKDDLGPAYTTIKGLSESVKDAQGNDRTIIEKQEIIEDPADLRHGALWRLANASKALFDAFSAAEIVAENKKPKVLQVVIKEGKRRVATESDSGAVNIHTDTKLSIGPLIDWVQGYEVWKKDKKSQESSLTTYLNERIRQYLEKNENEVEDMDAARAVFEHYGFLDDEKAKAKEGDQFATFIDIAMASPTVPRAVTFEIIEEEEVKEVETIEIAEDVDIDTEGANILELILDGGFENYKVTPVALEITHTKDGESVVTTYSPGTKFLDAAGVEYEFVGTVNEGQDKAGKVVAKVRDKDEYKTFEQPSSDTEKTIERGIYKHEAERMIKEVGDLEGIWKGYTYQEEHNDYETDGSGNFKVSGALIEFKGFMEMVCSEA